MDWNIVGNGNLEKNKCGHVESRDWRPINCHARLVELELDVIM